ncbi:MAG: ATP-binding protein [Actinomycetia bacterium]|nr:ATP-binding protein [Actinomycetes bacterium]MCH9800955.1 ATP-binding protein [Actinomycetes bacterium]
MDRHLTLSESDLAARQARDAVRNALTDWQLSSCLDDALLIASELVTNAATHGIGEVSLHLRVSGSLLRIEVHDEQVEALPETRAPGDTEPGGRGLHLVAALSSNWGWEVGAHTKTIWAEIPCGADQLASN